MNELGEGASGSRPRFAKIAEHWGLRPQTLVFLFFIYSKLHL